MPRLFLATSIPITPPLANILEQLRITRAPLSLVPPENLHVTLKFLGQTPPEKIDPLIQLARDVAQRHPHFEARLQSLGSFPNLERPSVIWCGLTPDEPFQKLAADLESAAEQLGFPRESRPFHPHLTLARIKGPLSPSLRKLWLANQQTDFGPITINSLTLFQSNPTPPPATYINLTSIPLP